MLLGSRFLGKIEVWDDAEAKLTGALNHLKATTGQEWHLNPGDGAFYGPKIDIKVRRPSAGWCTLCHGLSSHGRSGRQAVAFLRSGVPLPWRCDVWISSRRRDAVWAFARRLSVERGSGYAGVSC